MSNSTVKSSSADLAGKQLIVTGGTGALGSAVSQTLLASGATVTVSYIVDEEFAELQKQCAEAVSAGRLHGAKANLTEESAVGDFVKATAADRGGLDGVVNIAGGFVFAPLLETSVDQLDHMWNLNFRTLFLVSRAAYPHLKQRGGGTIVSIGARPGTQGTAGLSAYAASKAAVINFTQTLADEGRADGVRAFSVLPSIIDTPANRAAMPDANFETWVTPASLARVIRFVLEDESQDMSGAILPVYGQA